MIKNNKRGVSLIALVITIIVLIILVGIGYTASTFSIDRARFARFSTNFMNVQEAVRKKSATFDSEMVINGKLITDGQKYNYIAKNGKSGDEIIDRSNVPVYSIIEKNADLGIELPNEKVNLPNKSNVEVKYAVTSNGEVFSWPPTKRGDEYYITNVDVVSEEIIGKPGDFEIFVAGKSVIITTDENGELLEGTILATKDGKVMLSKPKIKGSYIYNGTVQTVSLTNYNSNVMNITNDTMKNAGTQTVTISLKDTERYLWSDGTTSSVSLTWTIDKKIVPVKWDVITSFIYDGTSKAPSATADGVEGETINLDVSGGATEIGTYTATASIQNVTSGNAENYTLTNTTKDFRITKGTIEVTATGYEGEYDDQEHFITVNVIKPETGTMVYYSVGTILTENNYNTVGSTTNPGIKEMGTWTVYYYVVAQGRTSASGSKTITIVKANINPVISMTDYVYGETKSMPSTEGVKENANVTYYYNTTNTNVGGTNWNAVGSTTLNVGTYYIYAIVDETAHYYGAKTSAVPFAVNKKSLIVTADAKTKIFAQNDPDFTYTYTGNVNGQTPKFSGALARQTGENVGTYLINQGTLSIIDNGAFLAVNYQINYNSANLTITQMAIDNLSMILNPTSVVYNGAEQKTTATISYGGRTLIEGMDYTLAYTNNINVGTATATATGKGNYKGTISRTFQITKRAITVTADSISKAYDGKALTSTSGKITTGSLENGQTITITSTGTITNVGSTPSKISSVVIKSGSTDVTSNYTITKNAGTLTITPRSVEVTWGSTIVFTYDGKAHAPTASTAGVNGETINLTVTNAINAGSYTSTASILSVSGGQAKASNYKLTESTKAFAINKKMVNVTWGSTVTFTYNKKWQGPTATVSSGVSNETIALNSTSAINAGNYTSTASITGVSGGQNNINNYILSNKTKAFTINAYNLRNSTIAEISKYEYDGNAKTPTPAVTVPLEGTTTLTNNVDFTYSYSNNINPGTATVTVTGRENYTGSNSKNFVIDNSCYHVNKRISSGNTLICCNCGEVVGTIKAGQYFKYTPTNGETKNYVVTTINNTIITVGPKSVNDLVDGTRYGIAAATGQSNANYYDVSHIIHIMHNRDGSNNYTKGTTSTGGIITSISDVYDDVSTINSEFEKNFRTAILNMYTSGYSTSINLMGSASMAVAGYAADIYNLGADSNGKTFYNVFNGASYPHDWALRTFCINYSTSTTSGGLGLCYYGGDGIDGTDSEEMEDISIQCPGLVNTPIYVDGGYERKGQFKGYVIPEITLNRCVYFSGSGTQADPYVLQGIGNW